MCGEPVFCANRVHFDIGKLQSIDYALDKARLFLNRFEQDEAGLRKNESEGDAGEARAGADVDDDLCIGEGAPGDDRIEDVFDGGLTSVEDAREVHDAVGFNDEVEVRGGFLDDGVAVREIGREEGVELEGEGHSPMMAWASQSPRRQSIQFKTRGKSELALIPCVRCSAAPRRQVR